jgi:hypothetical protein
LGEPWVLNGENITTDIIGAHYVHHATVDNLMLPNEKRWNEVVVRQVLSADLADKITSTPLVAHVQADRLIWKAEKNGRYSVKSAYRLCVESLLTLLIFAVLVIGQVFGSLKFLQRFET